MTKRNRYLEQLQRRQQAATAGTPPPAKPVEQMSDAELEQELASARAAARAADERAVHVAREGLAGGGGRHPIFVRKRRPSWK